MHLTLKALKKRPVILLKAMGSGHKANARGLVVVLDEGTTHFNKHVDSAKRALNSTTQVSGGNFLPHDVFTPMPTFVFVLSNDPIEDPALSSRMLQVRLERPTPETLQNHARTVATKLTKGMCVTLSKKELTAAIKDVTNFRDIERAIQAAVAEKMVTTLTAKTTETNTQQKETKRKKGKK